MEETLADLPDGEPLPPLEQTNWEETTLIAAPMAKDPPGFIRDLIPHNLPLAARCAAAPEVSINDKLKRELQDALIARTQNMEADLRARIVAGEALGLLGDPRFERRKSLLGDYEYLLPPLSEEIPGGTHTVGDDEGEYDDEKPEDTVELKPFRIGQFPVTNAEYALFIEADGYKNKQWWDTKESLAWLRGEASTAGQKEGWRDLRKTLQSWSEDDIRGLVQQNRATSKQADDWIETRNWTDEEFEQWLEETFPSGKLYREPEFWNDTRFNNPAQPVVGVTWFEARAYCNWLTANAASRQIYRLPSEAEFEAAARGQAGRLFPYGESFDSTRCNTFESHIRRTTPVGIFDNATPEGALDLSGNAYTWTLSIYNQAQYPYPYRSDDGREDIQATGVRRVLRGGSWIHDRLRARAVFRSHILPADRNNNLGFRVVVAVRPTPLVPLQWPAARATGEPSLFHQGAAVSGIAGRVRFASRGEELEKAQLSPVRTGAKHRRAHIKSAFVVPPLGGRLLFTHKRNHQGRRLKAELRTRVEPAAQQPPQFRHHLADVPVLPGAEPAPLMRQPQIQSQFVQVCIGARPRLRSLTLPVTYRLRWQSK